MRGLGVDEPKSRIAFSYLPGTLALAGEASIERLFVLAEDVQLLARVAGGDARGFRVGRHVGGEGRHDYAR